MHSAIFGRDGKQGGTKTRCCAFEKSDTLFRDRNGAGGVEQAHFPPVLGKCQMAKREGRGEERKGRFV